MNSGEIALLNRIHRPFDHEHCQKLAKPNHARYEAIRARHDKDLDLPYVAEAARILTVATAACAELIGAADMPPAQRYMRGMIDWYRNLFDPNVQRAISAAS